jgi:hypothetical protein
MIFSVRELYGEAINGTTVHLPVSCRPKAKLFSLAK